MTTEANVKLLSPRSAAAKASLSLSTLKRHVRSGDAPAPVRIGPGRVGFYEHELDAWLRSLPRTRQVA